MLEGLKSVGGSKRKRIIPAIPMPLSGSLKHGTMSMPPVPSLTVMSAVPKAGIPLMKPPCPVVYNRKDGICKETSKIKSPVTNAVFTQHFDNLESKPQVLAVCVECRDRKKSRRYCREVCHSYIFFLSRSNLFFFLFKHRNRNTKLLLGIYTNLRKRRRSGRNSL